MIQPLKLTRGQSITLHTVNGPIQAKVERIQETLSGYQVTYDIQGYGLAEYWYDKPRTGASGDISLTRIPKEYIGKRGKDFDWTLYGGNVDMAKKIVNAFVTYFPAYQNDGRGLYIHSSVKGSGKTLLSCCLCTEIVDRYGVNVKFCPVLDYLEYWKSKTPEAAEAVKSFRRCSLLILDDLGTQQGREWINEAVFSLVDYRYRENKPTIYTSNLPIDEASKDERTASRIQGTSLKVVLPNVLIRQKLAEKYNKELVNQIMKAPTGK